MNPFFPLIQKFYKYAVPVIEIGYLIYAIAYSFYWKSYLENVYSIDAIFQCNLAFFIGQWCILVFPLTTVGMGLLLALIIGIPLVIIDLIRYHKKRAIEKSAINPRKRMIQSYVGAYRFKYLP